MKSNTQDKAQEPKLQAGTSPPTPSQELVLQLFLLHNEGMRMAQPLFHGQDTLKPHLLLQSIWKGKSSFHVLSACMHQGRVHFETQSPTSCHQLQGASTPALPLIPTMFSPCSWNSPLSKPFQQRACQKMINQ